MRLLAISALTTVVVTAGTARSAIVGSELIDRNNLDASAGFSLIYRGGTQPLGGDGGIADLFSVYSRGVGSTSGQYWVTPFLLEITGESQYTIVAIGTSRDLTGEVGVRSFDFNAIAGDASLEAGRSYTFGYRTAQHEVVDGEVSTVSGTQNSGAVPFTGFDDYSDKWSYGFASELAIGTIFGTGGVGLDTQGLDGRIYSAQLSTTIPAPGSVGLLTLAGLVATRRRR